VVPVKISAAITPHPVEKEIELFNQMYTKDELNENDVTAKIWFFPVSFNLWFYECSLISTSLQVCCPPDPA
jgi:hypothetical protein